MPTHTNQGSWDISHQEAWAPEEFPVGMVGLEGGTAVQYTTGSWRSQRPVWDVDKCKQCMLCWVNCPDSSIIVQDERMTGIDYQHCKGCGICVVECRFEALHMVDEHSVEASSSASATGKEA